MDSERTLSLFLASCLLLFLFRYNGGKNPAIFEPAIRGC